MNNFIRAKVISNSIDDKYFRVRVTADGFWKESPLIPSFNALPLKKGDIVIVDVSQGFSAPLIVGKFFDADSKSHSPKGQVVAESEGDKGWIYISVNQNELIIKNSNNISLAVSGTGITINDGNNGGVINVKELTSKINQLITSYNAHVHSSNGTPPSTLAKNFVESDYEDLKFKH